MFWRSLVGADRPPKEAMPVAIASLLLLFLTFSALVANPKKLLYTVANPARGLLNRGKKKTPPPPARCSFGEKKRKKEITRRIHI